MDMIAVVLTLEAEKSVVLPAQLGRSNLAVTLDQIEERFPELGPRLHDTSGVKPLTCSGILGERGVGVCTLDAGKRFQMRVTGLTAEVASALHTVLVENRPAAWSLHRTPFKVVDVTCNRSDTPWAGSDTYAQQMVDVLAQGLQHKSTFRMQFAAPTAFRSAGITIPLPLPGLVFGSLLDRWNSFSPTPLDADLRNVAQSALAVSNFELRSVPVPVKEKGLEIGGLGEVTYTYLGNDPYWLHQLQVLATYAMYSGVGLKTTTGMGQCSWRR